MLVEALPRQAQDRALFGMDTEGAAALAAAVLWPRADLRWFHLDEYVAAKVRRTLAANGRPDLPAESVEDPPEGPFDLVALAFPKGTENLLARDLVEAAHDRLRPGGRLLVATDAHPDGLRATLKKVFGNWSPVPVDSKRGACFFAERRKDVPRWTDRSHVLRPSIRHGESERTTELEIETRPGTFSHGRVDRGTRALAQWMRPREDDDRILDLGAGCGLLGIYAALRVPAAQVTLVDSNVRAAGCARRNAARNGVADRVEVCVRADFEELPVAPGGGYALALANPPYFGDFRIARSFVDAAHRHLRPGGHLAMVAKAHEQHLERVREIFGNGTVRESDGYGIVTARK